MPLRTGKIPIDVLRSTVLSLSGAASPSLVTPPKPGLDFAAVKVGRKFMIVSADPVTGVVEGIGRYAVNVNANDVATSGSRPQFLESVILLPEGADRRYLAKIAGEMHEAALALGVTIVGGHTEVTPGLHRPIVTATAFSLVDDYVSSGDVEPGSTMMMTKTAGLEGTAILTGSRSLLNQLSVVEEAVRAYATGSVLSMHDVTEGGILGAAYEMSIASEVGFEIEEDSVPVSPDTRLVCASRKIDPLRLIGSGALLLSVKKGEESRVSEALAGISQVTVVGRFERKGRILIKADGRSVPVKKAPEDELWRVLGDLSGSGKGLRTLAV